MNGVCVRSAVEADLPELAALLGGGRPPPRLPADHGDPPEQLLVAEARSADGRAVRLLATVRLRPTIGLTLPRYAYHVGCAVHAAQELGLFHRQRTLLLGNDHTGAAELADLAAARDGQSLPARAAALRLVVQAALLLLASRRAHYPGQLMAELPGPRDSAGQSPFWQGLGRHFYDGDPAQAAERHGADWRSHVAALLPRQPVYASFLPATAQDAIARVHPDAQLQRDVLEEVGLRYGHHVAIDDGGPVLEAAVDALPVVTQARTFTVQPAAAGSGNANGLPHVVLRPGPAPRAARLLGGSTGGMLRLDEQQMATLGLAAGERVWALLPRLE